MALQVGAARARAGGVSSVILSVTTLKDTRANVEKWVRRNLAGGIDHMIVFLDGPQPEVEDLLAAQPDVTGVVVEEDWYADAPSDLLNDRQIVNAGLTCRMLAGLPWAEWLFHLDGDEVAQIDRPELAALPPETRAVRLGTLEAVGRRHPQGDPTLFKRRLTRDELHLLTLLGAIPEPSNGAYFRGHRLGKPGLRPTLDFAIGVHNVIDRDAELVELAEAPGLRLLHYESFSGDEFVRKWMNLLGSGGHIGQRGHRAAVAGSIRGLLELGLDDQETQAVLYRIYDQLGSDDVELLARLGLLVDADPDAHPRPVESSPVGVRQLRVLLDRARDVPKLGFWPKRVASDIDGVVAGLQRGLPA
jgi:hypothetical protein